MQITNEELGKHYAAMSDGELENIDPAELTDAARRIYELEMKKRSLAPAVEREEEDAEYDEEDVEAFTAEIEDQEDPDWLESAACACSFRDFARTCLARDALVASGVPCHLSTLEPNPGDPESPTFTEFQVMVPSALNLKAISVLDQKIFNDEFEVSWKAHLAELSDDELRALPSDVICAGVRDRLERMARAYDEEIHRRRRNI